MWYVDRGCGRAIGSSGNANELFEARFEDRASGFSGRPQNRAFRSNIDVLRDSIPRLSRSSTSSSSSSITRFFALRTHQHRRTDSTRPVGPDGTSTYHIHYESDLLCGRFKSNPAQICKYSPSKDNPLFEGTRSPNVTSPPGLVSALFCSRSRTSPVCR